MARVVIPDEKRTLTDSAEIRAFLKDFDIWYRRFEDSASLPAGASNEKVLAAYQAPVDELMADGTYSTADVVQLSADTPNLEGIREKFRAEHTHSENEVRFIVEGRGIFFIHPATGPVFAIDLTAGDMINVPAGTKHWFDVGPERFVRAIRLFEDPSGWTPRYTGSGVDEKYPFEQVH